MANRGISVADWENWKRLIYELYLQLGWTLERVTLEIERRYGVRPSSRQCKQRLKSWGYDSKRIPKPIWVAFHVVDSHHQHRCRFQILVRDGHQTRTITPEAIRKQIARYRNEPPESLYMSLADAEQNLHNFGVRVINIHDSPVSLPVTAEDENDDTAECSDQDGSDSPDSGNETSTVNKLPMLHVASTQPAACQDFYSSRAHFQPEVSPKLRLAPLNISSPTLCGDGSCSVGTCGATCPSCQGNKMGGRSNEILDFAAELATLNLTKAGYIQLRDTGASLDNCARHDAVHIVACYVRNIENVEKGFEFGEQHVDRKEAQELLRYMLLQDNAHLPSALNYLTMILHARASFEVYFAFLTDCWKALHLEPYLVDRVLATYIVFLCKSAADDHELSETIPHSQDRLQQWRKKKLTPAQFQAQLDRLVQVYGRESSAFIIMRYQYAWSQLQTGNIHFALELLVQTVKLSEDALGCSHLITINGLTVRARALEKACRYDQAAVMYEDCIRRLGTLREQLLPSKVRMQVRLAEVYILQGHLRAAEALLLQALEWRRTTFGMLHTRTWDVVEHLTEVYRQMHGDHRANAFYVEQQGLHNEHWRKQQCRIAPPPPDCEGTCDTH